MESQKYDSNLTESHSVIMIFNHTKHSNVFTVKAHILIKR